VEDAVGARHGFDVMLLVGGRVLYAHKLILGRRSPTFKQLITAEEWPGGEGALLQLLLPDLRYDVAKALLQFIYCDNLFTSLDFTTSLPRDLLHAARTYQLPRLEAICRSTLLSTVPDDAEGGDGGPGMEAVPVVPQSTVPQDLGGGIGDTAWSDVKFVAGGKALLAHRFMLTAKSEFFTAMFRSGMKEAQGRVGGRATVDVVVPDSYESMLRLLLYIYTGTLPDRSNEATLEDMMAADRYRLMDLKDLCESMVEVDVGNCLDVLRVADLYSARRLREAALLFIVRNLSKVAASPAYTDFAQANPALMRDLFEKIKASSPHATAVQEQDKVSDER
jgi:hypothetical protein